MKKSGLVFSLALLWLLVSTLPSVSAADLFSGTWKVNPSKSTFNPGPGLKAQTVTFTAAGSGMKVSIDSTGADGKTVHSEWAGKFDGTDQAMMGDPNIDTRSFRKIDDYTLDIIAKKNGKVMTTTRTVYSKDGRTRISTQSGTNPQGQKVNNTIFSEKQ